MRLVELFLNETSEEERALISLSSEIFKELEKYKKNNEPDDRGALANFDDEFGDDLYEGKGQKEVVGTIGELFDQPIPVLDDIGIEIWPADELTRYAYDIPTDKPLENKDAGAIWDQGSNRIIFSDRYLGTPYLRSAVTHELRHALDDKKSDNKANTSTRYTTPKQKDLKNVANDPAYAHKAYQAQPNEINARFSEVLNTMVAAIKYACKNLPKTEIKDYIWKEFEESLVHHEIANIFPERTKSKDYQRLVKRAVDFMQKEVAHQLKINKK